MLELGSGSGIVGMICALAGAQRTVLTDDTSVAILEGLRWNVERNAVSRQQVSSFGADRECICRSAQMGWFR